MIPIDPRDPRFSEESGKRRRTLDDGHKVFKAGETDDMRALMECAPGQYPDVLQERHRRVVEEAMATLNSTEYASITSELSVRELAHWLGVSKSTVQRARQSAVTKMRKRLGWLVGD